MYTSSGQYFQYLEQMLLWLSKALILSMTCEAGNSITLAMTMSRLIQVSRKGQKQGTSKGTHTLAVLFFYLCSNFLNCQKSIKSHAWAKYLDRAEMGQNGTILHGESEWVKYTYKTKQRTPEQEKSLGAEQKDVEPSPMMAASPKVDLRLPRSKITNRHPSHAHIKT